MREMLQGVQDDLTEQLAGLENHALAMTSWLERRMGERVDSLINQTRARLSDGPEPVSLPESVDTVQVEVFVDGDSVRRPQQASVPAVD
jgi:hypothetical protein